MLIITAALCLTMPAKSSCWHIPELWVQASLQKPPWPSQELLPEPWNKPHEQEKALEVSWLILKLLLTARMICTAGIVKTFCRRVVAFQKPLPPSFLHPSSDSSFNSYQQQDKEQIHELSRTALLEELKDGRTTNI